jgi:hypothetical protein
MAMLRLLTALVALVLILAQPRDAAAGSATCDSDWDERVDVFSCGGDPELRDAYCRSIAPPEETQGCQICADDCHDLESGAGYYWCRASSSGCSGA